MACKKIHKVTIGKDEFFIYADTKQGAVRDVLAHLKESVVCIVASGTDLFFHGIAGGKVIGMQENDLDEPTQETLALEQTKEECT